MVCKNCGREFEGTFCPSCGTKAEGALPVCPVCGAPHAAGDLFCPRCGYDYRRPSASVPMAGTAAPQAVHNAPAVRPAPPVQPAQPAEAVPEAAPAAQSAPPVPPAPASKAKLYGLLRYASAALLGLYAVLLFAFYAAPLASVFWSALGSVYDFKVFEGLKTASIGIVLIVFGVLTAVAAAVLALIGKKTVRGKKFCIFQKSISAEWLFAGVACAVYLVMLIVGIAAAAVVGGEDMEAGAAPILVIVFALVFAGATVGLQLWRRVLGKREPALLIEEAAASEAVRVAKKPKKEAAVTGHAEEALLAEGYGEKPAQFDAVNALVRFKRVMLFILFGLILPVCASMVIGSFTSPSGAASVRIREESEAFMIRMICGITFPCWAVSIAAALLFARRPKHKFGRAKMCGALSGWLWSLGYFILSMPLGYAALFDIAFRGKGYDWLMAIVVSVTMVSFIVSVVACVGASKLRKRARIAFYGTTKPDREQEPLIAFAEYEKRSIAYTAVQKQKMKPPYSVRVKVKWISFVAVTLAAVVTAVLVITFVPEKRIDLRDVKEIELGDYRSSVTYVFGYPYNQDPDDLVYEYYNGDYEDMLRRYNDLMKNADSLEDLKELARLEEDLNTTVRQYLRITFEGSQGFAKVAAVYFDAAYSDDVTVQKREAGTSIVELDEESSRVSYSVEYTDGSYCLGTASCEIVAAEGMNIITWWDAFGIEHSVRRTA